MIAKVNEKELFIPDAGIDGGTYDACDGTFVFRKNEIKKSDYLEYIKTITDKGFKIISEYAFGANLYTLAESDELGVYVSYLGEVDELRIYAEPKGFSKQPTLKVPENNEGDVTLWQLPVDWYNSKCNGGMTYALKCADGSFVLIDGGYYTDDEADRIYNLLKENTEEGKKPHIVAWFMTHMHGDHYGGMIRFAEKYANMVELDGYYFSGLKVTGMSLWLGMVEKFEVLRDMWTENKPEIYGKIHTGMNFLFPGVDIKVMCTQEDVYPENFVDANDTGIVLRIDAKGQRIFILGDCRDGECDAMIRGFAKSGELKGDIVQFSHHGYEGATIELHEAILAPTVLWPMNIIGWQETGYKTIPQEVFRPWYNTNSRVTNAWIRNSGTVKKIIVSGEGLAEIKLPYTPEGDYMPDLDAWYEKLQEMLAAKASESN